MSEVGLFMPSLLEEDVRIIQGVSRQLQLWANVSQADVFIDCFTPMKDTAIVVAEAHPENGKSLYKRPVIGEIALKENEPGVFFCLQTGEPVYGSRGISQEQVSIQQNITPIKNSKNETIAALIMERDITEMVEQEKHVEMLIETTEQLGETLFQQAMKENTLPSLIHEGLIIFNDCGLITFANERAHAILEEFGEAQKLVGTNVQRLCFGRFSMMELERHGGVLSEDFQQGKLYVQIKVVCIHRGKKIVGGILLLRDLTEMKQKDREIMIKSAVIKEIHHRVKNNLQTIASLLRLQMRRSQSAEVERIFRESINRIMSISIIHEVLSQDGLDEVDCKEIFEFMTKGIVHSMRFQEQIIRVNVHGDSLFLNPRNASTLALVVNELVQNAMNHAFQEKSHGKIRIHIKRNKDEVTILVADNGVGFQYEPQKRGNLGLEICHTLVQEDLNGTIQFFNTGKGMKVRIAFPIPEGELEHDEL
ncbi:sensor histidine kinase [Bacillus massilinigeriensis]|uniref:sensor histidine kinase n=1 Tax=Bacillus massilionigeriensis TaxID=1805475 RepID=UPI00096B5DE1|nr:sensor histidine kinase [Bacillus massilionigeriensis]